MKISRYCLHHPVIAIIANAFIILLGCLSLYNLGIREYPEISFPSSISPPLILMPSAELVESVITNPLEDALSGLEGLER